MSTKLGIKENPSWGGNPQLSSANLMRGSDGSQSTGTPKPLTDAEVQCYLEKNPDVKDVFGSDLVAVKNHWLEYGFKEGREAFCGKAPILPNTPNAPCTTCGDKKKWSMAYKVAAVAVVAIVGYLIYKQTSKSA